MEEANELVARLCTAAGIIMEDTSPIAVSRLSPKRDEVRATLSNLEEATRDANLLIQAAQVLARRNIR